MRKSLELMMPVWHAPETMSIKQWKIRGKTVAKLRAGRGITAGLCTTAHGFDRTHVDAAGEFAAGFAPVLRDLSTAFFAVFFSVGGRFFRNSHRPYNNNEVYLNNLLLFVRRVRA